MTALVALDNDEFGFVVGSWEYQSAPGGMRYLPFWDEAWATLQRIPNSLAWHVLSGAIRRCQMQHFPYGVIYEPAFTEIIVVVLAHLHREPAYWQGWVPHL